MSIAVCTLYEGDYHHGVAALVNSLVAQGFRGTVYVGFRGNLPSWGSGSVKWQCAGFDEVRLLQLTSAVDVVFLPLTTRYHLANYKPDLMLSLLQNEDLGISGLFYFDPDIAVVKPWRLFADWITCGVALCEDTNSPVGLFHPRRVGWRRFFSLYGIELLPRTQEYFNSGFVGVRKEDAVLLKTWITIGSRMGEHIGGNAVTEVGGGVPLADKGFFDCFDRTDQDGLNAALEALPELICAALPRSAMAFTSGDWFLPHAAGPHKPWRRRFFRQSLGGLAPSAADKAYWDNVSGPILSMPQSRIALAKMGLKFASAVSRFYRRG